MSVSDSDALETAVMRRKRKRTFAIDPCLGFYALTPPKPQFCPESPSPAVEREEATSMGLDLPKWTVMEEPRDDSDRSFDISSEDNVQLTVEKFLQRGAANARPIRKYGRRYRNRRVILSSRAPSDDEGQDPEPDSGQSNRRTLRFVSVNVNHGITKSAVSRPKARPMRFWTGNKRKGVPFRDSSFPEKRKSKPRSTEVATPQHPLSRWNTFKTPRSQTDSSRPSAEIPGHKKCTPLNFVPLAIAEKAYKKKKTSPKSTRNPESTTPSIVAPLAFATTFTTPTLSAMPALHTLTSATISPRETHPVVSELLPSTVADTPLATEREDQGSSSPDLGFKTMSASSKYLKPLGSFLDDFMERVRAATQADNVQAMARQDHLEPPTISVGQEEIHSVSVNKKLSTSGSDTSFGSAAHHKLLSNACFDDSFLDFDEDDTFSLHQVPLNINAALLAYSQAGEVRFA